MSALTSGPSPQQAGHHRHFTHAQLAGLSAYWAASNFIWGALLTLIIAKQVRTIVGVEGSAKVLGLVMMLLAIPAILVPLIVGPMSDRCLSKLGRRRPYILFGSCIAAVGLMAMWWAGELRNIWLFAATLMIVNTGNNIATAAYSGVIPDLVGHQQRGLASGYMAVFSQAGTLLGVLISGYLVDNGFYLLCYGILALTQMLGLSITMRALQETPLEERPPTKTISEHIKSLWIDPREYPDFGWVWLTRALVMLGFYSFLPFILYYLSDVVRVADPARTTGIVSGIVLLAAAISGYLGGRISDVVGRKKIVMISNALMAVICLGFAVVSTLTGVIVAAVLFGLAYGAYISVDWALGADVLPNPDDAAKDMAVWHVAMTLPQAIAGYPAGALIAAFGVRSLQVGADKTVHYTHAGYAALFVLCSVYLALGAYLIRYVKGVS